MSTDHESDAGIPGTPGRRRLHVDRTDGKWWRATFDNPPINLIDGQLVDELSTLVDELANDSQVRAVVFDSSDEEFYLAHFDVLAGAGPDQPGSTGMPRWLDVTTRLSRLPVVSIAAIAGRARGAGSEFVLACDLRFAGRTGALIGQPEVGVGMVPGGGPMYRLPGLVGRGRTLEIVLAAEDFDGELAERYGIVNRAIPDDELAGFVDRLAARIGRFDKRAIAETKRFVDEATLSDEAAALPESNKAFWRSVGRSETRAMLDTLVKAGFQQRGDTERRLGEFLGQVERGTGGVSVQS